MFDQKCVFPVFGFHLWCQMVPTWVSLVVMDFSSNPIHESSRKKKFPLVQQCVWSPQPNFFVLLSEDISFLIFFFISLHNFRWYYPVPLGGWYRGESKQFCFSPIRSIIVICVAYVNLSYSSMIFLWLLYVTESVLFFITWNMRECLRQLIQCSAYDCV